VPHIIVFGNEKGGSGKSTTAMHVATALVRGGHGVGCLDLDLRQRTLGRYVENRLAHLAEAGLNLPSPDYRPMTDSEDDDDARLAGAIAAFGNMAFVVIDCPGSHTGLSLAAHARADTLVTPLNDSFVDFDMLARVSADGNKVIRPSVYSEMVWNARQLRAKAGQPAADWIVVRNRLGTTAMHNKRKVGDALANLAKRIGFRVAPGFSERVIFRELFPRGLTLLDLRDAGVGALNLSNVAARQEVRDLMRSLGLPEVTVDF
jgi:chromosome partitioning protein